MVDLSSEPHQTAEPLLHFYLKYAGFSNTALTDSSIFFLKVSNFPFWPETPLAAKEDSTKIYNILSSLIRPSL